MILGSRQSRMTQVPLGFPLLTVKQYNHKEPGDFSSLEYGWLSLELGQPNPSMSRYRVHRAPLFLQGTAIVVRFQRVILEGSWGKSRVGLAFLLKFAFCPSLYPGYWPPQAEHSPSTKLFHETASRGLGQHISSS